MSKKWKEFFLDWLIFLTYPGPPNKPKEVGSMTSDAQISILLRWLNHEIETTEEVAKAWVIKMEPDALRYAALAQAYRNVRFKILEMHDA